MCPTRVCHFWQVCRGAETFTLFNAPAVVTALCAYEAP